LKTFWIETGCCQRHQEQGGGWQQKGKMDNFKQHPSLSIFLCTAAGLKKGCIKFRLAHPA